MRRRQDWLDDIALSRVETVDRALYVHPERNPKRSEAVQKLHTPPGEAQAHPNAALTRRDGMWTGYAAALARKMYLAGRRTVDA